MERIKYEIKRQADKDFTYNANAIKTFLNIDFTGDKHVE